MFKRIIIHIQKWQKWTGSYHRYYEINFDVFSPYDYSSEEETFEKAKDWLYEELKQLQENVKLGGKEWKIN